MVSQHAHLTKAEVFVKFRRASTLDNLSAGRRGASTMPGGTDTIGGGGSPF